MTTKAQLEAKIAELEAKNAKLAERLRSTEAYLEGEKDVQTYHVAEHNSVLHAVDAIFGFKVYSVGFIQDGKEPFNSDTTIWGVHDAASGGLIAKGCPVGKAYDAAIRDRLVRMQLRHIMAIAEHSELEQECFELRHSLNGEPPYKLRALVEHFTAKTGTAYNLERIRTLDARSIRKVRSAMVKMHIDYKAFRALCTEEPWLSLCETLIGPSETMAERFARIRQEEQPC